MKYRAHILIKALAVIFGLFIAPVGCMVAAHYSSDIIGHPEYSRHGSTGQAPNADSSDGVIQVYAARAARWRGALGVHTWIATKRTDERRYTRLEVIGYRVYWGEDAVRIRQGVPDGMWFGNRPTLLREIRGDAQVDKLIDTLHSAATSYAYNDYYKVWPGPNSNTFTAQLARQVPQLRLELPSTAIGKDYLPDHAFISRTPSGTGVQLSARGFAGILVGIEEGLELNLMGLTVGFDLYPPAIKLPGVGRIGFSDTRRMALFGANDQQIPARQHSSVTSANRGAHSSTACEHPQSSFPTIVLSPFVHRLPDFHSDPQRYPDPVEAAWALAAQGTE